MTIKETATKGLVMNTEYTPWCVYETQSGKCYWETDGIATLDEVIANNSGQCTVYVSVETFRNVAKTKPNIIIKNEFDREFTLSTAKPYELQYLPEETQQEVLAAIEQGGFAAVNKDLRFMAKWDSLPNTDRSSC